MTWIMGGTAVCVGFIVAVKDASAAPKRVCEEWRDYNFNAETGDFIEWVGDPYWICFDASGPEERVTRPKSPDPDRYGGGIPFPETPTRDKKCTACKNRYKLCMGGIRRGTQHCRKHYYNAYEQICEDTRRNRDGSRIEKDIRCFVDRDPGIKPVRTCFDFGIDNCVDGYADDWPSLTTEATQELSISAHFASVVEAGAKIGSKMSITWPGGTGYLTMCNQAGVTASQTCASAELACWRDVGGCR